MKLLCFDCHLYVFIVFSNTSGCLALSKWPSECHIHLIDYTMLHPVEDYNPGGKLCPSNYAWLHTHCYISF